MLCGRFVFTAPHERLLRDYLPARLVGQAADHSASTARPGTSAQLAGLVSLLRIESAADSFGCRAMLHGVVVYLVAGRRSGRSCRRPGARERIGGGRDHGAGIPVVPDRWPDHPQRRWRHRRASARCGVRADRLGLPLPVPDMDNDDAASGRRGADGWAAVDHPRRSGGAGRCLGDLGDISRRRA